MSGPEPPRYTKYRARPKLFGRKPKDWEEGAPGAPAGAPPDGPAPPGAPAGPRPGEDGWGEINRGGRGGGGARTRLPNPLRRKPRTPGGPRRPITVGRVFKWLALAVGAWLLLSLVVFLVSAQIQQGNVSDATDAALAGGGLPLTSPTTILVLGSDQRPEGTKEAGASTSGPSRSDSILLLHVGGGKNGRMSIARDTMVDIPGRGRDKVNAAYAYGGAALAITTISQYLDTPINHVIEVSFTDFPELIDAMGGINYTGSCVKAKINGGYRNGGVTLRIPGGKKTRLDGKKTLALARVRKNDCNPKENDLTRARRQQRILGSMRSRVLSPNGFVRLPWISWQVPRAFKTDMSGPTLMAVFANLAMGGTPETAVLGTPSGQVPESVRDRAVRRFLDE
jgi:LCP family protein required for cell wall assembly